MKKKSKFEQKMLTFKLYIYMKSAIKSNRNKKKSPYVIRTNAIIDTTNLIICYRLNRYQLSYAE